MISKKVLVILVIIAIALSITAAVISSNSSEVKTSDGGPVMGGGNVGIEIIQPPVNDKLANGQG